jgi:hypothetical protein
MRWLFLFSISICFLLKILMSKPKFKLGSVVTGPDNVSGAILNILTDSRAGYKYIVKPPGKKPVVWKESEIK